MIKNFLEYIKESMTTDVDGLLSSINDKKGDNKNNGNHQK